MNFNDMSESTSVCRSNKIMKQRLSGVYVVCAQIFRSKKTSLNYRRILFLLSRNRTHNCSNPLDTLINYSIIYCIYSGGQQLNNNF